jgi:methylated-DNA-[protein]-cysteine S-methyltransferase
MLKAYHGFLEPQKRSFNNMESVLFYNIINIQKHYSAIAWSEVGIVALTYPQRKKLWIRRKLEDKIQHRYPYVLFLRPIPRQYYLWVQKAWTGRLNDKIILDLNGLPDFQKKILEITKNILIGNTCSYSWIADHAGFPNSSRAVGNALNKNPIPLLIPCHRVVLKNHNLGGFRYGHKAKWELLKKEKMNKFLL